MPTLWYIAGSIAACIYPIPEWIENKCKELLPFVLYKFMEIYEGFIEVQKISQEILKKKVPHPNGDLLTRLGNW